MNKAAQAKGLFWPLSCAVSGMTQPILIRKIKKSQSAAQLQVAL